MSEKSEYKISVGNTACDFRRETFLISPTDTTLETNPINFKKTQTLKPLQAEISYLIFLSENICFSVRQAKNGTQCQYFLFLLKLQWIISMINNNHPSLKLTPALLLLGNVYNQLSSKHREMSSLVAGKTASCHPMLGKSSTPVLCILGLGPHHSTLQGTPAPLLERQAS